MCTLTFVATAKGAILTHSRDEDPQRRSSQKIIQKGTITGTAYFPQDLHAKGTWMAAWQAKQKGQANQSSVYFKWR